MEQVPARLSLPPSSFWDRSLSSLAAGHTPSKSWSLATVSSGKNCRVLLSCHGTFPCMRLLCSPNPAICFSFQRVGAAPITIIQETIWVRYFRKNGLALVLALGLTSGKLVKDKKKRHSLSCRSIFYSQHWTIHSHALRSFFHLLFRQVLLPWQERTLCRR